METYYVDGRYVSAREARIPVDDLAVLRGYGVFDFLRTYGGRPFFLTEHLQRLQRSAGLIGLDFPWSLDDLHGVVAETLERNAYPESNIRLVVTGGGSSDFITPQGRPRLIVMVTPLIEMPSWWYSKGVKVITARVERYIPEAKTINYIPAIMALSAASRQEAVEAVYIDSEGKVFEGTTSNVFAVVDNRLITPGQGVLPGITRKVTLSLVKDLYEVEIGELQLDQLLGAEEVFLTSSNKEIAPVIRVNDARIGDGRPGRRTLRIMDRFATYTAEYAGALQ